jgi:hypothetical protein
LYILRQVLVIEPRHCWEGQVFTKQGVEGSRPAGRGDLAHARCCPGFAGWSLTGFGTLFGLVFGIPAGSLAAQSRGDMQVGAQVLPAGPSQAALASALNRPPAGSHPDLADITRVRLGAVLDSAGVALKPRSVVTISFLRN